LFLDTFSAACYINLIPYFTQFASTIFFHRDGIISISIYASHHSNTCSTCHCKTCWPLFSHTCCSPQISCPAAHMIWAYDGIREATAAATLQAPVPDPRWLQEFQAQLHIRGARPHPKILTSLRTSCPHCHAGLTLRTQRRSSLQVNNCSILSDSGSIQVYHAPKFCSTCKWPRLWCGYMQTKEADTKRTKARVKTKQRVDIAFQHPDVWMCHRFFGITTTWLRRWRYRMYLQRASFQSEALLPTLADGVLSGLRGCFSFLLTSFFFLFAAVSTSILAWHRSNCRHCYPHGCRATLSDAWVRELLWRRGQELDAGKHRQLAKDLKSLSVETLISKSWIWYAPLMLHRRDTQWLLSGDRRCTVAVDGNAKLHRRTCGQPFAEATLSFNGNFALLFKPVLLALVISYLSLPICPSPGRTL